MKLRVVQISESAFSVQGHGVHTAYVETLRGLEQRSDINLTTNNFRSADVRHIHTVGPYSLAQLLFARGKKVVSAHIVPESLVGSLIGARYWVGLARQYLRWFYNRADVVIAVSESTKQELRDIGVSCSIEVVNNMIDTLRYKVSDSERRVIRKKMGIGPDETVVIGNGQVQPRKRVDSFIAMAKHLPETRFIWVGGMPFGRAAANHSDMERLIDTAPKNVTFTGVVPLDKVREYFAAGDIFVMTSEQETFGLAIVEAAASGMPVVLRDIPDYDHTFRDDAVVCSEDQFVKAIQRLTGDKKHYTTMQKHAADIAKRFDSQTITSHLVEVYHSCARKMV